MRGGGGLRVPSTATLYPRASGVNRSGGLTRSSGRACCSTVSLGQTLARTVERLSADERIDQVADPVADAVRDTLDRQPTKDILSGVWLGHPLHPLLTDLPIGFWTSAFTLDLLGGRKGRRAATQLVAWGVLSAVPTALQRRRGLGRHRPVRARRIGLVHAASNTTALACYAVSWWSHVRGRHPPRHQVGLAGAAATVGGYLGGHLLQSLGVGVDHTATAGPPSEWTRVAAPADVTETHCAACSPVRRR